MANKANLNKLALLSDNIAVHSLQHRCESSMLSMAYYVNFLFRINYGSEPSSHVYSYMNVCRNLLTPFNAEILQGFAYGYNKMADQT